MSHVYYREIWRQAHLELDALLSEDLADLYQRMKKEEPRLIFEVLAGLYLRYIQIFRKFETCLDQIVHPQKRQFLRQVVGSLIGRLQELKFEMVNLEQSDFQFLYTYAQELGYTMMDLDIPVPRYLIHDRHEVLQEREALLRKFQEKRESILVRKRGARAAEFPAADAAGILLQLERSRQAWLTVAEKIRAKKDEARISDENRRLPEHFTQQQKDAALRIQMFWKATKIRQLTKKYRRKELEILNIIGPDLVDRSGIGDKVEEIAESRRLLQRKNEAHYQKQLSIIKEQLRDTEGPGIVSNMELQIRQWFLEYRDATGSFPDYPTEEEGGSASLFVKKNPQQLAMELDKLRRQREEAEAAALEEARLAAEGGGTKGKGKGGKEQKKGGKDVKKEKKKPEEKKGKDNKKGKGKGKGEEDEGWTPMIAQSAFIKDLTESMVVFHDFWERRSDDNNANQEFDTDIVKADKRVELKNEIRLEVDKNMRTELDYLKLAIDGQKPKKKKKGKKGKKGKKEKKEKDLTPNRTTESIVEELAMQGIMVPTMPASFTDYYGSARYIGQELRTNHYDFDQPLMPQAAEIRNILRHYCILNTAESAVRERMPVVKSLLLVGPPHNGKHLLSRAVCTALGACRFNLDLSYIKSRYRGKPGIVMLVHLIFKMAKLFQPSVLCIEWAEYLVGKKGPKQFKLEYKALKKELLKTMKKLPLKERILILGLSSSPSDCEVKAANSVFNKIVPVPLPDFHARVEILNRTLAQETGYNYLSLDPHLLPTVAKISEYFSTTQLVSLAKSVISWMTPAGGFASGDQERRFNPHSVTVDRFIPLCAQARLFAGKPLEQFEAWYAKMPINKKRRLLLEDELGVNNAPKGKKKSNKAQKK